MKTETAEEWRDVKGWEGYYQVSNLGRVRRLYITKPPKVLRYLDNGNGYATVQLARPRVKEKCDYLVQRRLVHRLVAIAFQEICGRKWGKRNEVDHIDANRMNNIATNLRWVTHQQNMDYKNEKRLPDIEII